MSFFSPLMNTVAMPKVLASEAIGSKVLTALEEALISLEV